MKVLLLVPNLTVASGGVGNIYKVIDLPNYGNIRYFFVNAAKNLNTPATLLFLAWKYLSFIFTLLFGKYDVVHVNPSLNAKSFYRDGGYIRIAKLLGTPVITFFHGWEDDFESKIRKGGFSKKWFMHTFAHSDKFIVLGQIFKDKLIGLGVSPQKQFFLETTVADDSFLPDLNLEAKLSSISNGIDILFISRIVKEKGVYQTIDAFQQVFEKYPEKNLRLLIAGSGPELDNTQSYVAKNDMDGISFLGFVTGKEKGEALVNSHILLFPTYYGEGLPCTVLEAMLYGMPVISRINAGIPDIIENDVNGFITESMDHEVFASYLETLITDEDKYCQMARANHAQAKSKFTSSKVRDRILDTYATFEQG